MIKELQLENFRGFERATVELAPLTILTGANNSGKSTIMYALLALKNFAVNPNQPLDSFFNFTFMNLGGFKECVYMKDEDRRIGISVTCETEAGASYQVEMGKLRSRAQTSIENPELKLGVDFTLPYALNQSTGADVAGMKVTWNGISAQVAPAAPAGDGSAPQVAGLPTGLNSLQEALALPVVDLKAVDFVPLKRGFTKPNYSAVPLQAQVITEDELATVLANDRDLEGRVNYFLERIVNKNFQTRPLLSTANFFLQTSDRESGFVCDLVNDGFGTNALVYLLAKALRNRHSLVFIEEPEIHVHPGALVQLAKHLRRMADEGKRQYVISTHSEHLVLEILNCVRRGEISKSDLRIYFLERGPSGLMISPQAVNEKGQIEGGLRSFYDIELRQVKDFLGVNVG